MIEIYRRGATDPDQICVITPDERARIEPVVVAVRAMLQADPEKAREDWWITRGDARYLRPAAVKAQMGSLSSIYPNEIHRAMDILAADEV